MNIELFRDVILTVDLPRHGLRAGDIGTVVDRHLVPSKEEGFSVEFFDMTGQSVAVATVPAHQVRLPTVADRPTTRTFSPANA